MRSDLKRCLRCENQFIPSEDKDGNVYDKLCSQCFEDALEAFEERRRERIALENEY